MSLNKKNNILLILVIAISISFFQFRYLNEGNFIYFQFLFLSILELFSVYFIFKTNGPFVFSVKLISISIFFSTFMAYFSWGQSFFDSLKSTIPYMLWFFFFYLMNIKLKFKSIERIIVFYGILYVIFYLFQFSNPDLALFGSKENTDFTRGILRIIFPGGGVFFLMFFIALNKLSDKKNKYFWFWIVIVILGIVITVMQVTRQLIGAVLIIYFIHFFRNSKFWVKIIGISALSIGLFLFVNSENPIVKGLRATQDDGDAAIGKDYIRVIASQYFLTDFSPNTASQFLGNGVPYGDKSKYGRFQLNYLWAQNKFYFEDVGIIGAYALFGIFAVVGFIIIWIKSFTIPLPANYKYLKYYLWFILLTSVTSDYIYRSNYLITNVIVVFMYNKIANKNVFDKKNY